MSTSFRSRHRLIGVACAGIASIALVGLAVAGNSGSARGGASIAVENRFAPESGLPYMVQKEPVRFTVVLSNSGGASPTGARLAFAVPNGLTEMSWSCSATPPAECQSSGSEGAIDQPLDTLLAGGQLVYTVFAQQLSSLPPYVESTASVSLPVGGSATCSDGQTQPCRSSVRVPTGTNLSAVLVGGRTSPGNARFTFTATHSASSRDADGTQVVSTVPPGVLNYSWSCEATISAALCPNASGSGPINETIGFWGFGGDITYTIDASMASGTSEEVSASVQLIPPKGGSCGAEASAPPCIAIESLPSAPHVTVSKTAELLGSGDIGYTVIVANDGPGSASVVINDDTPVGLDDLVDFLCTNTGSATCPSDPRLTNLSVVLPADSSLVFGFSGVPDELNPEPVITNTVTVDMPDGLCNAERSAPPCAASVATGLSGTLRVEKTASTPYAEPGELISYRIDVFNESTTTPASMVSIIDDVPAGIADFDSWTCVSTVPGECPSASGSGAIFEFVDAISPGAGLTYTVQARVDSTPSAVITNEVRVVPEIPGFRCAPDGSLPPCVAHSEVSRSVTLEVSKSVDKSALSNGVLRYELLIRKSGPNTGNVRIADAVPAGLTGFSWTCESTGSSCPPGGSGAIDLLLQELPPGDITYRILVDAAVSSTPPAQIVNTLSVDAPATVRCMAGGSFTPPPCIAGVTTQTTSLVSVTKTASQAQLLRGGIVNYLITVANEGATVSGVGIQDSLPAGLESMDWTCTAYLGVACPSFSGSGSINLTTGSFPPDSRLEFNVTGSVAVDAPKAVINVATITPPGAVPCVPISCSASVSVPVTDAPAPNFLIALTSSATQLPSAGAFNYTVDLRNVGMMPAKSAQLLVPMPDGVTAMSWTCDGAQCPAAAGTGAINETLGQLSVYDPALGEVPVSNGRLVYTISANVSSAPPATIELVATVVPSGVGSCVSDVCTRSLSLPTGSGAALLDVVMTADRSQLLAGGVVGYEITLRNNSAAVAGGIGFNNPVPAGLGGFTWQCTAVNNASCPQASGSGAINQMIEGIASNSAIIYTISANVSASPPVSIVNTATVTPSSGVNCSPSCAVSVALPVASIALPDVIVSKRIDAGAGVNLAPGQAIVWTISAMNSGAPTSAVVTLSDRLPSNIRDVSVTAGAGVSCSSTTPSAGALLTCAVAVGFTGQREVRVAATAVSADAQGGLRNTVQTSGADAPRCVNCTVTNPMIAIESADIALRNARAYSAAGIAGTLVDVVNLSSSTALQVPVRLTPSSAQRLLATFASGCVAANGTGGSVTVSCPNPPSTQGVSCAGSMCTIDRITQNSAVTLFIALNPGASASLRVELPGDSNPVNDVVNLPAGAAP